MNFQLVLFTAFIVTGIAYFADVFFFKKRRVINANLMMNEYDKQLTTWQQQQNTPLEQASRHDVYQAALAQPAWLDITAGLFPVIAAVFILRSFIAEPFKIPSGSMIPTLLPGDFILVDKFHYGIRLPIINVKVINNHSPERGDVMVFRYPADPKIDYIKRVIGLPGDVVEYSNKRITVNGMPVETQRLPDYYNEEEFAYMQQFTERTQNKAYTVINNQESPSYINQPDAYPLKNNCVYFNTGIKCSIPQGHYFVMGDNRDNSRDSRYWGFVPEANIVGKAFFVWLNLSNFSRIGTIK